MKRIFSIFLPLFLIVAGACAQNISFTASEWATSQGLSNGAAVTDFTKDGVTVRFAQGSAANAPTYNASYCAIAAAGGSSLTITVPEGKQLTQAVFTMYNATMANNLVNATWSAGEKTASGNAVTWTSEEESLTVTFSATEGFVAFSVTFSEPPLDPSFSYNDTTVLDIPAYVAQWQEDNPWDEWPTGPADSIGFTVDDKLESKTDAIMQATSGNPKVKAEVKILLRNVPFWFQTPWIETNNEHEMIARSQTLENDCLYMLSGWGEDLTVTINQKWSEYLKTNYEILRDFTLWNLTLFLQTRNPNVPNISGKLIRPEEREALTKQKKFWNIVIELGGAIDCIYTGNPLGTNEFDLDHFMPWSFVSHNQNWNLIPADGSFNSSKNNRIPDLDYYLPKMAKVQHNALRLYIPVSGNRDAILDEYFALGASPQDLMAMSDENFLNTFRKTFSPLSQMAINMGFRTLNHE